MSLKNISLILGFMTLSISVVAQIPNGGFETNSGLPSGMGEWQLVDSWTNAFSLDATPDYFHNGGTFAGDLPETPVALVNAFEGNAIMGFVATGVKGTNKREYLSVEMDNALEEGKKYQFSFSITNGAVTANSQGGLGTSELGIAFTVGSPVQSANSPLELTPKFVIQSVLYDREWIHYTFSFIANEAFSHLTIGVFGNDDDKEIQPFEGTSPSIAYYFVDDFRMQEIPVENTAANEGKGGVPDDSIEPVEPEEPAFFIPNAFTPNGDGDNDLFFPIVPSMVGYKFCIYDRWGQLLFSTTDINTGWNGKNGDGSFYKTDVYAWELRYDLENAEGEWISRVHQGTVNLLR